MFIDGFDDERVRLRLNSRREEDKSRASCIARAPVACNMVSPIPNISVGSGS